MAHHILMTLIYWMGIYTLYGVIQSLNDRFQVLPCPLLEENLPLTTIFFFFFFFCDLQYSLVELEIIHCILCSVRFPEARAMKRKIIFHAGPTNSGKTHAAIERFHTANSGVYCGPLRLLAAEVFKRANHAVS